MSAFSRKNMFNLYPHSTHTHNTHTHTHISWRNIVFNAYVKIRWYAMFLCHFTSIILCYVFFTFVCSLPNGFGYLWRCYALIRFGPFEMDGKMCAGNFECFRGVKDIREHITHAIIYALDISRIALNMFSQCVFVYVCDKHNISIFPLNE